MECLSLYKPHTKLRNELFPKKGSALDLNRMSIKLDGHALVQAMKELAVQLQKTPTRDEFKASYPSLEGSYRSVFGGYSALVQASGLDPVERKKIKITNEVFNVNLERHLEVYNNSQKASDSLQLGVNSKPWPKIAILPDVHFPWESKKVLSAFYKFIEIHQPDYICQIGDLYDAYSHAKFPRSHNIFLPREETQISREKAVEMWATIRKLCPSARLTQCTGNHDLRPIKRILEVYPAAEDWIEKAVKDLMTFDGVHTIYDTREELIIGDIAVFHGYRGQVGAHRDYTQMNCITGHVHRGNVSYRQIGGRTLWELHTGFAGDPEGKGLTYTPQKISTWTHGFGFVWPWGPQFIPV